MHLKRILAPGCAAVLLGLSGPVQAHGIFDGSIEERVAAMLAVVGLLVVWVLYVRGAQKVQPARRFNAGFHLMAGLCAVTLLGPLDSLAEASAAAHMTQHMLLIAIIAPLWVLSRPLPQISAGGGHLLRPLWRPLLQLVQHPMLAAYIHGAVIWFWHSPAFYMMAVRNPWWHLLEHLSFLLSGVIFWWAVLKAGQRKAPWALLALLFTLMHTGFLGALLSFAREPLYGEARDLQDQQLAGMIMWVVGSVPYLIAAIASSHRWYGQMQRRMVSAGPSRSNPAVDAGPGTAAGTADSPAHRH